MAYSVQQFTSTGTEDHVILSFQYLDKADIHLYGNSVETAFVWVSSTRIDFPPFPAGTEVVVRRLTNRDRVRYLLQEGAPFTREILDQIHTQALYLAQEAAEGVFFDMYGDIDMHGFRVRNAGAPEFATDYTTKGWVEDAITSVNADYGLRADLAARGGLGLIGEVPKPITWGGFAGGAVWDGVTNDNLPYRAAAQSGKKFYLPSGVGNITDISVGLFNQKFSILGDGAQIGSLQYPVDDYRAARSEIKYSKYRGPSSGDPRWDTCAMYTLVRCPQGGVAPKGAGAALTGYIRAIGSEGGDHVGVHARAEGDTSFDVGDGMGAWGAWISAVYKPNADSTGKHMKTLIGCEIDVQNDGVSAQRKNPTGVGELRGLVVGNTGTGHLNQGVDIVKHVAGSPGRWWSGMRVRANSIVDRSDVATEDAVGECILLEGGVTTFERYGGIKFHKTPYTVAGQGGHFSYGVDFSAATFRLGNAVVLGAGQRVTWDSEGSKGVIVEDGEPDVLKVRGYSLAINDAVVLKTRRTGFARMTGTPLKTSFNADTATLTQVAQRLKAIEDALHADSGHGLYGLT